MKGTRFASLSVAALLLSSCSPEPEQQAAEEISQQPPAGKQRLAKAPEPPPAPPAEEQAPEPSSESEAVTKAAPKPEPPPAKPTPRKPKRKKVRTTTSGLKYEVLREGDGEKPSAADRVTVHYRGELVDGTVFDSSYDRGQPATFPLNGVIRGWTEGLQLMPVGSKYKFTIPPELGYGARGAGGRIPPNATLIFEVELLSIAGR